MTLAADELSRLGPKKKKKQRGDESLTAGTSGRDDAPGEPLAKVWLSSSNNREKKKKKRERGWGVRENPPPRPPVDRLAHDTHLGPVKNQHWLFIGGGGRRGRGGKRAPTLLESTRIMRHTSEIWGVFSGARPAHPRLIETSDSTSDQCEPASPIVVHRPLTRTGPGQRGRGPRWFFCVPRLSPNGVLYHQTGTDEKNGGGAD